MGWDGVYVHGWLTILQGAGHVVGLTYSLGHASGFLKGVSSPVALQFCGAFTHELGASFEVFNAEK